MKEGTVGFKSVWGFDPDEVIRAQRAWRAESDSDNSMYNAAEEGAARTPGGRLFTDIRTVQNVTIVEKCAWS